MDNGSPGALSNRRTLGQFLALQAEASGAESGDVENRQRPLGYVAVSMNWGSLL